MHTCSSCGKTFEKYSKLERHANTRTPCCPPTHHCDICNKGFASYQSLWNHKQRCQGDRSLIGQKRPRTRDIPAYNVGSMSSAKRPRSPDIPTFDGAEFGTGKPKSKETMDKLERFVRGEPAKKKSAETQAVLAQVLNAKEPSNIHPQARPKVLPPTTKDKMLHLQRKVIEKPQEVDDGLISFTPMKLEAVHGDVPRLRAVDFVTKQSRQQKQLPEPSPKVVADIFREKASSKPRTKGDLIGYSDDEGDPVTDEDDDSVTDEDDESVTDENSDSEPDEIVIPDTAEGLRNRFNKLFVEFTREKKHDHRHELTLLLDEMLKHEAVTPLDYTRLNSLVDANLPERASDKEDEDDEGEEEEDYEKSTFNYIIQHDREELFELLEELKGDEEFIDEILNLEKLIGLFLENEFLEGEPTKKMVEDVIEKLRSPNISKSQKHRLKMLLGDIGANRYRISSIFTRLFDTENSDQMKTVLKLLKQEELLSAEQFQRLSELEEPDAPTIAAVIKESKIGQGVKFLPRTINLLQESLHSLLAELKEKGSAVIKDKLAGVLEELWKRHAISETGYNSIKETL